MATLPALSVRPGEVRVNVRFALPEGYAYAAQGSSGVTIRAGGRVYPLALRDGRAKTTIEIARDEMLHVELMVYYCGLSRPGTCFYISEARNLPLRVDPSGAPQVLLRLDGLAFSYS